MTTYPLKEYEVTLIMSGHNIKDIEEQLESLDSYEIEDIIKKKAM